MKALFKSKEVLVSSKFFNFFPLAGKEKDIKRVVKAKEKAPYSEFGILKR